MSSQIYLIEVRIPGAGVRTLGYVKNKKEAEKLKEKVGFVYGLTIKLYTVSIEEVSQLTVDDASWIKRDYHRE